MHPPAGRAQRQLVVAKVTGEAREVYGHPVNNSSLPPQHAFMAPQGGLAAIAGGDAYGKAPDMGQGGFRLALRFASLPKLCRCWCEALGQQICKVRSLTLAA